MATIPWGKIAEVGIPAAATTIGGFMAYKGAKSAADIQSKAVEQAIAFNREMYNKELGLQQPWQEGGLAAMNELMRGYGLRPFKQQAQTGPSEFSSPLLTSGTGGSSAFNIGRPSSVSARSALELGSTGAGIGASVGGPVGAAVGGGIGAAAGFIGGQFGKGRRQADQIVPLQNAIGAEVDRITKAVNAGRQNGTLTKEQLTEAMNTVQSLQDQFKTAVGGFNRAGPGGVDTLAKYFDPLKAGWQAQINDPNAQFASSQPQQEAPVNPEDAWALQTVTKDNYQQDPYIQTLTEQGNRALERYYASRGQSNSRGFVTAATKLNQNLASQGFMNAYNMNRQRIADRTAALGQIAGFGSNATNALTGLTGNFANNTSNLITEEGAARAAGEVGGTNALNTALSQGANLFQQGLYMNKYGSQYGLNKGRVVMNGVDMGPTITNTYRTNPTVSYATS